MPKELALRMPGIVNEHPGYRIPNWHPARSKVIPAEQWIY
jgi:hypothetical protein